MKLDKNLLLTIDLVVDNEWLDRYIDLINAYEFEKKIPYKTQRHHIIPQFYYNFNKLEINNELNNLVNLPIKEHIIAHYYLARCSTDKYKGLGYASINYILRNEQVSNLPELEEFVSLLDNIEELYTDFRIRLAEARRDSEVRLKKSNSCKATWAKIVADQPEWFLERNKRISELLKGRPKTELHKMHLSESRIASGVAKGSKNPFFQKQHSEASKELISCKNGDVVIASNNKQTLSFNSLSRAVQYIIDNNIDNTLKKDAIAKHIRAAAKNNTVLYSYNWLVIHKERSGHIYSEEGLNAVRIAVAQAKGIKLVCSNSSITRDFISLAEASKFILSEGLDTIHYKNVGRKIIAAIENNTELYGFKWDYK